MTTKLGWGATRYLTTMLGAIMGTAHHLRYLNKKKILTRKTVLLKPIKRNELIISKFRKCDVVSIIAYEFCSSNVLGSFIRLKHNHPQLVVSKHGYPRFCQFGRKNLKMLTTVLIVLIFKIKNCC